MSLLPSEIYGMPPQFSEHLQEYCSQMRAAIRANKHHDHRLNLLLNFLRQAFSVEVQEVELSRKVKAGRVRGRIDAFFRYIIFEMKCDLERERGDGLAELKKYFEAQDHPDKYVGVLSDGLDFEIYHHREGELSSVRSFRIEAESPAIAFQEMDELLATRPKLPATSAEICLCFGVRSTALARSLDLLTRAFDAVRAEKSVQTKFHEWDMLLAKVYGTQTQDLDMFLKHTYLAFLSRGIVVEVLFRDAQRNTELYRGLIDGAFFRSRSIHNLAEADFFAWGLGNAAEPLLIELIANLFRRLDDFRFDRLDQDLLKMLYQELVEPADRHTLGEYYTPDWLAQLTLDEIGYREGRLLDPSCGSGTFLYFAIRRLREGGRKGAALVSYVQENIIGIDVHPLAVLMAKANILVALANDLKEYAGAVRLSVYLADTLLTGEDVRENTMHVVTGREGAFRIPLVTLESERPIDDLIDEMVRFAELAAQSKEAEKDAAEAFAKRLEGFEKQEQFFWRQNFRHMTKMIRDGRNTVWAFILKNAYRPVYLRKQKCRYVVGNPPWLSYRYIEDEGYKERVRQLTFDYGLLKSTERRLFTQIDTSTLFFVHCQHEFLEEGGTIAFVMPKSAIVPSQQHAAFQRSGFSALHDFSEVSPLFNVRACLMIRHKDGQAKSEMPLTEWKARLDQKNPSLPNPRKAMEAHRRMFKFPAVSGPASPYYNEFVQGATLVPRSLWFVECVKMLMLGKIPLFDRNAPYVETTQAAQRLAKPPWKVHLQGKVENRFLFATVLAENLLPFGVRQLSLVVLPVLEERDGSLRMLNHLNLLGQRAFEAHDWVKKAEEIWEKRKKRSQPSLQEYLDWQQKLTRQRLSARWVVLYNRSGTNLAAALTRRGGASHIGRAPVSGFVADNATYRYYASSLDEGHYLVGVLNSDVVNQAIKPYQTQGLWGERDIHRRPFEVCPIPRFDPKNPLHRQIAKTAQDAERQLKRRLSGIEGTAARARAAARQVVKPQLARLDDLVRQLFGEAESAPPKRAKRGNPGSSGFLSMLF
jgi:SAM-dependent methyltransferase